MKPLSDTSAFSDLVARIYAAGLDPERWREVIEQLHEQTGGLKTQLFGHDAMSGLNLGMITSGYDETFLTAYEQHFGAINPWVRGMKEAPAGKVLSAAEMCPFDDMARTEFYNDWVVPQGDIRGGGGLMLFNDEARVIMLGANIENRDMDRLEEDWLALCALLRPHLEQAFEISRQIASFRLEAAAAGAVPAEAAALILVGRSGRIIHASAPAQAMLAAGSMVRFDRKNRLHFAEPGAEAAFREACAGLATGTVDAPGKMALADGMRRLTCRMVPFGTGREAEGVVGVLCAMSEPCLLLCFDEERAGASGAALLAERYGLTAAETEVADMLAAGHSVADISELRGASVHTVRNQLKAVMTKCQVPRQADLVRLMLTLRDGDVPGI
uniref:helix-turn-helix transcriptional regulator n=1 Tax=Roseovarius indicus TaxID=540747 RepID=UPI003B52AC11